MNTNEKSFVGSWMLALEAPETGAFIGMLTLTSDGCVIANEAPGPYESTGQGSWSGTEANEAGYTFHFLFGSVDSKLSSKGKVVGKMRYDPGKDCWEGPWKIEVVDAEGKLTFATKGTHTGTRIAVESL